MRVQVNLSDDMVARVDHYAKIIGVPRSTFCSVLIGQGVMAFDKSMSVLDQAGLKLSDAMLNDAVLEIDGK